MTKKALNFEEILHIFFLEYEIYFCILEQFLLNLSANFSKRTDESYDIYAWRTIGRRGRGGSY